MQKRKSVLLGILAILAMFVLDACGARSGDENFSGIEQRMAEYPGGMEAFQRFIVKKVRYPKEAMEANVQGQVYVRFVVTTSGAVNQLQTVGERIGYGLEEEAVRVVAMTSGKWQPAVMKGKYVNVRFQVPINFSLE